MTSDNLNAAGARDVIKISPSKVRLVRGKSSSLTMATTTTELSACRSDLGHSVVVIFQLYIILRILLEKVTSDVIKTFNFKIPDITEPNIKAS